MNCWHLCVFKSKNIFSLDLSDPNEHHNVNYKSLEHCIWFCSFLYSVRMTKRNLYGGFEGTYDVLFSKLKSLLLGLFAIRTDWGGPIPSAYINLHICKILSNATIKDSIIQPFQKDCTPIKSAFQVVCHFEYQCICQGRKQRRMVISLDAIVRWV